MAYFHLPYVFFVSLMDHGGVVTSLKRNTFKVTCAKAEALKRVGDHEALGYLEIFCTMLVFLTGI